MVLAVIFLIRYIEKHQQELKTFLTSIQQGDFSISYPESGSSKISKEIHIAYNALNGEFQKLREEKEANRIFLQTVVEHINIPLIGYEESYKIILINEATKKLFNRPYLNKLKSLENIDPSLPDLVRGLNNEQKILVNITIDQKSYRLSVQATEIKLGDVFHKLVSFQDISQELDAQELDSFQKLIRVLTHEIMNSVIPISTLAKVLNDMVASERRDGLKNLTEEEESDIIGGLQTIHNRSLGLVRFVQSYKSLTRLPEPKFSETDINDLIEKCLILFNNDFKSNNIELRLALAENTIKVKVDRDMIEQVLINLLKNAKEAVSNCKNPRIQISIMTSDRKSIIVIEDNGPGISGEEMQKIFIPFYTTKEEGSGIGLSLSRRIMWLHNGNLKAQSLPGATSFIMEF